MTKLHASGQLSNRLPSGLPTRIYYEALKLEQYHHLSYKTQVFVRHFIQTAWNSCESGTIEPQGNLFGYEGQWHGDKPDDTHALMEVICKTLSAKKDLRNKQNEKKL